MTFAVPSAVVERSRPLSTLVEMCARGSRRSPGCGLHPDREFEVLRREKFIVAKNAVPEFRVRCRGD